MSEHFKNETSEESEVLGLLKRMQQQMAFLEKKIDILVNQAQQAPSRPSRHFSKPGGSFRHSQGGHGQGRGDRDFRGDRPGRPFEGNRREGQGHGGFGGRKKKPFFRRER